MWVQEDSDQAVEEPLNWVSLTIRIVAMLCAVGGAPMVFFESTRTCGFILWSVASVGGAAEMAFALFAPFRVGGDTEEGRES